jgi:hypothetical protein
MRWIWVAALWWGNVAAPVLCGQTPRGVATVRIPGTSNPYLAGMPRGSISAFGDISPRESPVLVDLSLAGAAAVTCTASGLVQHSPYVPPRFDPPNGSDLTRHLVGSGAENGISDVNAPIDSLVGVFLDDDRPDTSPAPPALDFHRIGLGFLSLSPQLKQVFFIGAGTVRGKKPVARRFLVPKGATRLFLGTMDGFQWNNNQGSFTVTVTIERSDVSSSLYSTDSGVFSVDSQISFARWVCLPDRSQCTPDRPVAQIMGPGQYHVVLPAQSEWGARIPTPAGTTMTIHGATGTVCLDSESRSTSSCNGPAGLGNGARAGAGYLAPDVAVGALIGATVNGQTYFSVNDRSGAAFRNHQGYFEFDVTVK